MKLVDICKKKNVSEIKFIKNDICVGTCKNSSGFIFLPCPPLNASVPIFPSNSWDLKRKSNWCCFQIRWCPTSFQPRDLYCSGCQYSQSVARLAPGSPDLTPFNFSCWNMWKTCLCSTILWPEPPISENHFSWINTLGRHASFYLDGKRVPPGRLQSYRWYSQRPITLKN
jgi:hypothetical protein